MTAERAEQAIETPDRARRAPRLSADERQRRLVITLESLLASRPLHEISVDDLARGVGLSRSAFYFYFASMEQVLLSLLDRLVEEQLQDERELDLSGSPADVWRQVLSTSLARWSAHRGVIRASIEARSRSAEVAEVWSRLIDRFVTRTATAIDAERARGAAPAGIPARDLAICLVRMNEKVFECMAADQQPALAEDDTLDALVAVWLTAIYGTAAFTT